MASNGGGGFSGEILFSLKIFGKVSKKVRERGFLPFFNVIAFCWD